jgi:serine/threonine-protein kinase HipA
MKIMAKILDVYLLNKFVGKLEQDRHGQISFQYASSWLEDKNSIPLSYSLPLRSEKYRQKDCKGFFEGILPEEEKRETIAKILGISSRNEFAMLEQIGGECAGAITFIESGTSINQNSEQYRKLSDNELAQIIHNLPKQPLMAGEQGIRLSMAGAQDKLAVCIKDGQYMIPLGNAISTHIIKPEKQHFLELIDIENFCMKLSASIGIPTARTEIKNISGSRFLLVERYDRIHSTDGSISRLHQEDFCQAMGKMSMFKYEAEGGPSLVDCFSLIREISSKPTVDLLNLFDVVIFNFLIGNNDAHAKNFSILYKGKSVEFAPLYDLISTIYFPELANKMAMKIDGEYISDNITPKHFNNFAIQIGFSKPMVKDRICSLAEKVLKNLSNEIYNDVTKKTAGIIAKRSERIIKLYHQN